jgi:pimeloyl-ACP methyl ester carboxylesterase
VGDLSEARNGTFILASNAQTAVESKEEAMTTQSRTQEQAALPSIGEALRGALLEGLPVADRQLELAGISTAVLEGGAGTPMVLLHGPGAYGAAWLRVLPQLTTTHHVVAPDLPGHGASGPIDGAQDVDRTLAWLGELIERTCPTPPILLGQIFGGAIAARFASRYGRRLRQLVLADTLGLAPFQPAPEFGNALMAYLDEPNGDTHDGLWRRCAFDLDALRHGMGESWQRMRAYTIDRARTEALQATQHSLFEQFGMPAIPPDELARIKVPTALIWGRQDLATPLSAAEAASRRYGWPLHVIENAADDPAIEQPDVFLAALRRILAGVTGGEAAA